MLIISKNLPNKVERKSTPLRVDFFILWTDMYVARIFFPLNRLIIFEQRDTTDAFIYCPIAEDQYIPLSHFDYMLHLKIKMSQHV